MNRIAIVRGSSMRLGWANAFKARGHEVVLWEPKEKPAFDFFSEIEPELLVIGTWELTRAIVKNLVCRPNLRVMLWGSHYGSFDSQIDRQKHGQLLASDDEKSAVEALKQYRPDINPVFVPYVQGWANVTHDRWSNLGLIHYGLPPAADHFIFSNGVFDKRLEADVSFVGKFEPEYGPLLLPLCREFKVKLFGSDGWPVAQYLGTVLPQNIKNVLSSAKVCPNIYTTAYGFELGERPFHILAAGGVCVSLGRLDTVFNNDQVVLCDAPEDFREKVKHYVAHPEEGIQFVERGLKAIEDNHTYVHRLDEASPHLGLT